MELLKENRITLSDGHQYTGWGYFQGGSFIPQGCGKKFFDGYYAYGNFVNGVLNGPAIVSHNYQMNTAIFKNNRANGWGLCINSGILVEFGYYDNSQMKVDLLDFVEWYYEKLSSSGRESENMLNMYTFNESKEVAELLIGYSGKDLGGGLASAFMGFRFKSDGSVWVGSTASRNMSGDLIHFRPDGQIDAGTFENGVLIERKKLHEIIDDYFSIFHYEEGSLSSLLFGNRPKSPQQIEREKKRSEFNSAAEIKIGHNYILGI